MLSFVAVVLSPSRRVELLPSCMSSLVEQKSSIGGVYIQYHNRRLSGIDAIVLTAYVVVDDI